MNEKDFLLAGNEWSHQNLEPITWITPIKGLSTGTPVLQVYLGMISLHPSRISHSKLKEISLSWSLQIPTILQKFLTGFRFMPEPL